MPEETESKSISEETMPSKLKEDPKESNPQWTLWTAASYAIVMLVIGLPLWWKTTTVQRVPLPYSEMASLHQNFMDNLKIKLHVQFKGFSNEIPNEDVLKFQGDNSLSWLYSYKIMSSVELDIVYKSQGLREIDLNMCKQSTASDNTDLTVYYVGRADLLKEYGHRVVLGNCRYAYYISNLSKIDMNLAWNALSKLVSTDDNIGLPQPNSISKVGTNGMKEQNVHLPLSAGYDILLSLLIPQPEILDCTWKIEKGVQDYIQPMIKKLAPFAEFTIRSQTLYYVKLNVVPKLNSKTNIYEVPYEQLPLVINPVESKLTSFVSQNPALNFLIYTAPCEEHPMQILDEDGIGLKSNAFLVPQWGGIQVYNAPCSKQVNATDSVHSEQHDVKIPQIMAVIISQFRSLLGLPETENRREVLDFHSSALRDWEVDAIVRNRLRNLMLTSANTIKSLGNLLDQITNIVVEKEVGLQVEKCVYSLKAALKMASVGDLMGAQEQAILAFKASEIAFHHPTNLAQLYFPDDQKYAIYIPLFLPVGIPVLLSLRVIFQRLLGKTDKEEKVKNE